MIQNSTKDTRYMRAETEAESVTDGQSFSPSWRWASLAFMIRF